MDARIRSGDSWGSPATTVQRHVQSSSEAVRDDWDDDEGEEETEDPQKLWEEANQRAPMPELVLSGSSTSSTGVVSPPVAAFQPVLKILKRPTATSFSSSSTSSTPTPGSASSNPSSDNYAAREARYQAARERIFGDTSPAPAIPDQRQKTQAGTPKTSPPPVQIAREPKGPPADDSGMTSTSGRGQWGDSRGFGNRRGKRRVVAQIRSVILRMTGFDDRYHPPNVSSFNHRELRLPPVVVARSNHGMLDCTTPGTPQRSRVQH